MEQLNLHWNQLPPALLKQYQRQPPLHDQKDKPTVVMRPLEDRPGQTRSKHLSMPDETVPLGEWSFMY